MKRFTLLLAGALIGSSAFSEVLTPEAALSRAQSTSTARHIKSLNAVSPELLTTFTAKNQPAVYLFSRSNNNGYLVVSADDMTEAVLGYSDNGTIDVNNMPPAMTYMLENYADQIAYARENASSVAKAAHAIPERAAIHPMCATRWAQNSPYNDNCPNQYPTGCTATALAQVLKYFGGIQGSGTASYNWNGQTLSFDFDKNTLDWDNMLDSYDSDATDAQKAAVANLMYACGVTLSMNYKSGGSGAYAIQAVTSSAKYFNLDKGIRYFDRDYFKFEEWNDLIYDALKNCGPVMLGGCIKNTTTTYAHEFVCDGYADNNLFHINWGWAGEYDGYFMLSVLDPYSHGQTPNKTAYNYYQDAVCYIQPAKEGSAVYEFMYSNGFSIQGNNVSLGSNITIGSAINGSSEAISGKLGIKISDVNGNFVQYVEGNSSFSNVARSSSANSVTVTLPTDLADGTYTVTPAFIGSGDWQDIHCKVQGVNSYSMTVNGGKASFTADGTGTLKVTDFAIGTPFYKTDTSKDYTIPFRMSAKISSDEEYSGKIAMVLYDSSDKLVETYSYTPIYLTAGESIDFDYYETSTTVTEGATYKVAWVDGSGNLLTDKLEVTVEEGLPSKSWKAKLNDLVITNADAVDKHDIEMTFNISCTEGFLFEMAWFTVYEPINDKIVIQWPIYPIALVAGETREYHCHYDFPDAIEGTTYKVYPLTSANAKWLSTKKTEFTIASETNAVNDITTDTDNVVEVEYYNLQGVKLGATVTTPGLYIKAEKLSNGELRTSRCIIR